MLRGKSCPAPSAPRSPAWSSSPVAPESPLRPLLRPPEGSQPELVRVALPPPKVKGAYVVDAGGRPIQSLEAGSTLDVGAQSLRPRTLYEFRATVDGRPVTFSRATPDGAGQLEPFVLGTSREPSAA